MLKKLFVTAAAAAAVSVPLAGLAYADQPDDPGAGNQGVPDRAAAAVEAFGGSVDGFQSGNSTVVAPGTAYSTGAKVPGLNTPDGYGVALNTYWENQGIDPQRSPDTRSGAPFQGRSPSSSRMGPHKSRAIRAARIPFLGCGQCPLKGQLSGRGSTRLVASIR
jgi:hypothetical protein